MANKKQEENKQEKEYTIILTNEEIIQKIRDIESNENWLLAMKVKDGIRLDDERVALIGLVDD